jgi:hypothetical protein
MLIAVILESVLVLEGLHAHVARETWRVVVMNREMLSETTWKRKAFCADGTFVCLVIMVQLVIFQAILALEAFVALLALVDLVVVHDLMLL